MSKKLKIPIEIISLEEDGNHLFLHGKIGEEPVRLLIDTGASKTVLDKNFIAEKIPQLTLMQTEQMTTGVGSNTIQSEFTEINNLHLGNVKMNPYKVAVLDLRHVNETYGIIELPPIHGVIGCDLLVEYHAVINLKKKQLRLNFKKHRNK